MTLSAHCMPFFLQSSAVFYRRFVEQVQPDSRPHSSVFLTKPKVTSISLLIHNADIARYLNATSLSGLNPELTIKTHSRPLGNPICASRVRYAKCFAHSHRRPFRKRIHISEKCRFRIAQSECRHDKSFFLVTISRPISALPAALLACSSVSAAKS